MLDFFTAVLDLLFSWQVIASLIALIFITGIIGAIFKAIWRGRDWYTRHPHSVPVRYLNARMAVRPSVLGHPVPDGYRLASLYFGTGLIDRTRTLDQGFAYDPIDPIPPLTANAGISSDISRLCDARARAIVTRAQSEGKKIRLLWSGGIDSTAAGVALIRAAATAPEILEFAYTPASRSEYPAFFHQQIKGKIARKKFSNVSDALDPKMIIVTGEHGDQLFGSITAARFTDDELHLPWGEIIPQKAAQLFATPGRADEMLRYLQPQIDQCPIPLHTTFDLLWWLNFSLKWQSVTLRLCAAAPRGQYSDVYAATEHFFRPAEFQSWSLANPDKKIRRAWKSYKWPLKEYIFAGTGDRSYRDEKTKEPSLRGLLRTPGKGLGVAIDTSDQFLFQPADDRLKKPRDTGFDGSGFAVEVSFSDACEAPLWDAIDGSDGGE